MWSIAIYTGTTPFNLEPSPPVLTKSDITDIPADFVADPFNPTATGWPASTAINS